MLSLFAENLMKSKKEYFKKYKKHPLHVDIIFEAGMFNGSEQIGFLCYLKKMEENGCIHVHRLSGCSAGSIVALCYYLDNNKFDFHIDNLSKLVYNHVKKASNVDIFGGLLNYFKENITENIFEKLNGNLFISFHDMKKGKQIVKNHYKNMEDLFETIRKSCSVPFMVDDNLLYKERYIDGFYPYMFKEKKGRKIINLNIINTENITKMMTIKNEKTNTKRVIDGMIDSHKFFTSNLKCSMCSFVDKWSLFDNFKYFLLIKSMTFALYLFHKILRFGDIINNSSDIQNFFKNMIRIIVRHVIK